MEIRYLERPQPDPYALFIQWYRKAQKCSAIDKPNAACLATADDNGRPSARIILVKQCLPDGFIFFTNYDSRKGDDLVKNPYAELVFFWDPLGSQIRIYGEVAKTSHGISESYFHARPRESQINAAISPQSRVVASRLELEVEAGRLQKQLQGNPVPCPDFWGGFQLSPQRFEFWRNRQARLHDRIRFEKKGDQWIKQRLAP